MIITIEGVDGSGKTELAKKISNFYNLKHFEVKQKYDNIDKSKWIDIVYDINKNLVNEYSKNDNFVKDRYHLSEFVYQNIYNRNGYGFDKMDCSGIEKNILILILIDYELYVKILGDRNQKIKTFNEFEKEKQLFIDAFNKSSIPLKKIIHNNKTFNDLFENTKLEINNLLNDNFLKLCTSLLQCKKCEQFIESCKEVNPFYSRPILPNFLNNQYMFIGIAPGRGKNIPFSIKAFSHSSGNILKDILCKLNIYEKCYFTNIVKCNTLKTNFFDMYNVKNCINNFLQKEIEIINPKVIFLLGKQCQLFFDKYVKTNIKIIRIHHPSYFNYCRNNNDLFEYENKIKENI